MKIRALLFALLMSFPAFAVAVDEEPLQDPAQEALARVIMKDLRCLVCQNQSIEDSNAELAQDLRRMVRERVALGEDEEQVKAWLVDRYGEWVLLTPPVSSRTYLLWGGPILMLLLGGLLIIIYRGRKKNEDAPLSSEEEARLRDLLDRGGEP